MPPTRSSCACSSTTGRVRTAAAWRARRHASLNLAAQEPADQPDGTFAQGTIVLLHGLQSKPHLNGRCARVESYDASAGRHAVALLYDSQRMLLKPSNLQDCLVDSGDDDNGGWGNPLAKQVYATLADLGRAKVVERRDGLSAEAFRRDYLPTGRPLIMSLRETELADWAAFHAWARQPLQEHCAHVPVEEVIAPYLSPEGVYATTRHWTTIGEFIRRHMGSDATVPSLAAATVPPCVFQHLSPHQAPALWDAFRVPRHFEAPTGYTVKPSRAQREHLSAALEGTDGAARPLRTAEARTRQAAWLRDCEAGGAPGGAPGSGGATAATATAAAGPIGGVPKPFPGMFQFLMGRALAGAHVHAHGAAWNVLVHGEKRWFLFPPETPQHIAVVLRAAGLEPKFGLPALEWFRTEYQVLKRSRIAPLEVIQRPGDVIWVPEKWGHAVINLKPSVGFAMEIGFSS